MTPIKTSFLLELYLLGRKIRSRTKHENHERILDASILNLLKSGDLTVTQVSDKLFSQISATSEKIISLEKKGFIKRVKNGDKRNCYVRITKKGTKKFYEMKKSMKTSCFSIFDALNRSEVNQINNIVHKLTNKN